MWNLSFSISEWAVQSMNDESRRSCNQTNSNPQNAKYNLNLWKSRIRTATSCLPTVYITGFKWGWGNSPGGRIFIICVHSIASAWMLKKETHTPCSEVHKFWRHHHISPPYQFDFASFPLILSKKRSISTWNACNCFNRFSCKSVKRFLAPEFGTSLLPATSLECWQQWKWQHCKFGF